MKMLFWYELCGHLNPSWFNWSVGNDSFLYCWLISQNGINISWSYLFILIFYTKISIIYTHYRVESFPLYTCCYNLPYQICTGVGGEESRFHWSNQYCSNTVCTSLSSGLKYKHIQWYEIQLLNENVFVPTRRDQDKSKEYFLSQTKPRRDWPNIFETKATTVTLVLRPGGDQDSRPLLFQGVLFEIQANLNMNDKMKSSLFKRW